MQLLLTKDKIVQYLRFLCDGYITGRVPLNMLCYTHRYEKGEEGRFMLSYHSRFIIPWSRGTIKEQWPVATQGAPQSLVSPSPRPSGRVPPQQRRQVSQQRRLAWYTRDREGAPRHVSRHGTARGALLRSATTTVPVWPPSPSAGHDDGGRRAAAGRPSLVGLHNSKFQKKNSAPA